MYLVSTILLEISIPGARSLKEKRNIIKPIIYKIKRDFNVSISEVGHLESWKRTTLVCAHVSNTRRFSQSVLSKLKLYIENHFHDIILIDIKTEFL